MVTFSPYEDLLREVMTKGASRSDRTGTGTKSVFGRQLRFDLSESFPLITTKRIHFKSVAIELLWFLRGESNIRFLQDHDVKIWNAWANEEGELGPVYGVQWRSWPTPDGQHIDQISNTVAALRDNPYSRRHLISAWNVAEIPNMALPPCHVMFQFYVAEGKLSCLLFQRSADMFLGVPFNIASYALLTHMFAQQCGWQVGELIWTGGDIHIYDNHQVQVWEQLQREPYDPPKLTLVGKPDSLFEYTINNFRIEDYRHHPSIKAPIAV